MAANWRDGRWHVVKAFPKPFVWLRRNWLALRWDGEAWERYGQWYSRERAEEEVRMLNDTDDWIDSLHNRIEGRFDSFDPLTGELFEMKTQPAPVPHWVGDDLGQLELRIAAYMAHDAPQAWGIPATGRFEWHEPGDRPDGLTLRALDRSHLGCG